MKRTTRYNWKKMKTRCPLRERFDLPLVDYGMTILNLMLPAKAFPGMGLKCGTRLQIVLSWPRQFTQQNKSLKLLVQVLNRKNHELDPLAVQHLNNRL